MSARCSGRATSSAPFELSPNAFRRSRTLAHRPPPLERRVAEPVLAAEVLDRYAGLGLHQKPDDLRFRKPLLHVRIPSRKDSTNFRLALFTGSTSSWAGKVQNVARSPQAGLLQSVRQRTDGRDLRNVQSCRVDNSMQSSPTIVVLLAAAIAVGCATSSDRHEDEAQSRLPRLMNSYYGVIDSIRSVPANDVFPAGTCGVPTDARIANMETATRPDPDDAASLSDRHPLAVLGCPARGAQAELYLIRIRFDDRSYRTVWQAHLDGLQVGDGVRIERGRVRSY